ncbi:MAG: NAD-dependent epimerase/dehydratase family protein [Planctomycetota bacterium]|nr:NAD-dependent epimerase/dehydratase family protein [Planctomycetota bacterium]
MKNILVTGGTGLLGNNIVRELLANDENYRVSVAVRNDSNPAPFEDLDVQIVPVDFHAPDSVEQALDGVDTVFHSAGMIWFGWMKLEECRRANVGITSLLGEKCREKDIQLIHVSSVDALPMGNRDLPTTEDSTGPPKPQCNYVVSKTEADQAVRKLFSAGLRGSIVHPGLMFGPHDWKPSSGELIQAISKMGMWFSCPTGGISVADVRDVARGAILAALRGETGRNYILAGHNIAYRDMCNLIADKLKVSRPRGRTGPLVYAGAALVSGFQRILGNETIINTAAIQMARLWHFYSSERAMTELGYQIRPLDESLDTAIAWMEKMKMIRPVPK